MMIPGDLKYTKDHEWAKIDLNHAVIGITDHAQKELGDITFVEVPETKTILKQGGALSTVESVKAASDIYAPVSGEIIEANEALADKPELINQSPYEKGWLCKIKLSDPKEASKLMDARQYEEYLNTLKK
ncbi:MAG: glycine cleavage system protein GcvH [Candidatus Omnitrophica bacterium]|nr:glycine cleavage system protein GcvH [Candidatus Omnitrophota bacterium]